MKQDYTLKSDFHIKIHREFLYAFGICLRYVPTNSYSIHERIRHVKLSFKISHFWKNRMVVTNERMNNKYGNKEKEGKKKEKDEK